MHRLLIIAVLCPLVVVIPATSADATSPGINGALAGTTGGAIAVLNPTTGNRALLMKAGDEKEGVSWSPTGDRLAVVSGSRLMVLDADGAHAQTILQNGCVDGRTSWSPDGSEIIYGSCSGLAVVGSDGSDPHALPVMSMFQGEWSPDGQWIVGAAYTNNDYDIWKVRPDGSESIQLTDLPGDQLTPTWSPDGQWVAFEDRQDEADFEIAKVSANGGAVTDLTNNPANDFSPSWSPDGTLIAFGSSRSGRGFTMATDGSDQTTIAGSKAIGDLVWQPAQVVLTPAQPIVLSGSQVRLDVRLAWPGTDQPAVLIQRASGTAAAWSDVGTVMVDALGEASLKTEVRVATRFRAIWAGDTGHPAATSIAATVQSRVRVGGHLFKEYARSGGYYLYHAGDRVWYTGTLDPALRDVKLCFQGERRRSGHWRRAFYDCYAVHKGTSTIYIYNVPRGFVGRIRAVFEDTKELIGDMADWAYFRVTGSERECSTCVASSLELRSSSPSA